MPSDDEVLWAAAADTDPVEVEGLKYLAELIEAERAGERGTLEIGPFAAFTLISMLQLVTRHPGLSPAQKEMARGLGRQLEPWFVGTPGEELIRRGSHPEWDYLEPVPDTDEGDAPPAGG